MYQSNSSPSDSRYSMKWREAQREGNKRTDSPSPSSFESFFLSVCVFVIIFLKQFRCILGNCPPTPPLCQHFALSVNVGLGED